MHNCLRLPSGSLISVIHAFFPFEALADLPLPEALPFPLPPLVVEEEGEEDQVVIALGGRGLNCNRVEWKDHGGYG